METQTSAPSAAPHSPPAPGRNEARDLLLSLRDRMESLHAAVDALSPTSENDQFDRAEPFLPVLFNMHDVVFRHTLAIEAGEAKPSTFAFDLLKLIEGEFAALQIDVIRPSAGEEPDFAIMKVTAAIDTPWWRVPGQITRVETCGFAHLDQGKKRKILRKAGVVIYKRRDA